MLSCFRPQQIRAAVEAVTGELQRKRLSFEAAARRLEPLVFRDFSGEWWGLGVRSLRWYRHSQGRWEGARTPPHRLEGVAGLVPHNPPERLTFGWDDLTRCMKPLEAFQALFQEVRQSYEQGHLHSDSVHDLIRSYSLVEREGSVWTLGFQSRGWFYYGERQWWPADDPPDPQGLIFQPEGSESLPELIVREWNPPLGLPESPQAGLNDCHCGYPLPPDALFCPRCGKSRPLVRPENCRACAKKLIPECRFCAYCGQPVRQ